MLKLYSDGSSLNKARLGAFAFLIHDSDHKIIAENSEFHEDTTNNRMEMAGVIAGLQILVDTGLSGDDIEVISDSQYVIRSINEKWSKEKNRDLWTTLAFLSKTLRERKNKLTFSWVRGHNGNHYNEIVDERAGKKLAELRAILASKKPNEERTA